MVFGVLAFGVPLTGRSWRSLACACSARCRSAAWACCVASRAKTIEAVSGLMNVVMLPMWMLSGVFFSSANFPDASCSRSSRALPLTALNDALRAVMIEAPASSRLRLSSAFSPRGG